MILTAIWAESWCLKDSDWDTIITARGMQKSDHNRTYLRRQRKTPQLEMVTEPSLLSIMYCNWEFTINKRAGLIDFYTNTTKSIHWAQTSGDGWRDDVVLGWYRAGFVILYKWWGWRCTEENTILCVESEGEKQAVEVERTARRRGGSEGRSNRRSRGSE